MRRQTEKGGAGDQKPLHRPFDWSWNQVDAINFATSVPNAFLGRKMGILFE
jgi:hypothetical protein